MPETIVNASTLINLASIGELSLLKNFEGKITVPSAVWKEVVEKGENKPGANEVKQAREDGWIHVIKPKNRELITALNDQLDPGESESIALAVEQEAEWIFLDEADAREIADSYDLRITGVLGLLIKAHEEDAIDSIEDMMRKLQTEAGFWISDDLYSKILDTMDNS